jgi:hypothetical protein
MTGNDTDKDLAQQQFILRSTDADSTDSILKLYRDVRKLFASWGAGMVPDVEMSIKIGRNRINSNRYSIPIYQWPLMMDISKACQILQIVDAPDALFEVVRANHARNIRMAVGIDYDNSLKKVYFYDNEREAITGYGFNDSINYNSKIYRGVRDAEYGIMLDNLRAIVGSEKILDGIRSIVGHDEWFSVYEMSDSRIGNKKRITGYHISPLNTPRIANCRDFLVDIAGHISPETDRQRLDSWLERNKDASLYWFSVGRDRESNPETTLYIRPEFYRPPVK